MTAPQKQTSWDEFLPDALLAHRAHTSERITTTIQRNPTDEEIGFLRERRLEHVQNLARFRQEANQRASSRMEKEVNQREEQYQERDLGIGDLVKRRHEASTKLHPRWDGPFLIRDMTVQRRTTSALFSTFWFSRISVVCKF